MLFFLFHSNFDQTYASWIDLNFLVNHHTTSDCVQITYERLTSIFVLSLAYILEISMSYVSNALFRICIYYIDAV